MSHVPPLPPDVPIEALETRQVLRKLSSTHRALAEVKGVVASIPNERILIDTLSLQEAKDSSAVENIVTTHDELYKSDHDKGTFASPASKEVHHYADALKLGFQEVEEKGVITRNMIVRIQGVVEGNDAGIQKVPGTRLKNDRTGELIFEPPQDAESIEELLRNLEAFMNGTTPFEADPLVKLALIHHQFESIHPFYDGNGRTGRIINLLYLIKEELLHLPVLYISRYIIRHRPEYYRLLQEVREKGNWEEWILYILDAIEVTSRETATMIHRIRELMQSLKHRIKEEAPKIYSQDLINNLFRYPYTKIVYLEKDLQVHRLTATKYLKHLDKMGIVKEVRIGRTNYYVNTALFELMQGEGGVNSKQ